MSSAFTTRTSLRLFVVLVALVFGMSGRTIAHEIPNEVTVLTFLKPEGRTLTLLVRAPLKSMRDIDIPTSENGFLDFSRIDTALNHATTL